MGVAIAVAGQHQAVASIYAHVYTGLRGLVCWTPGGKFPVFYQQVGVVYALQMDHVFTGYPALGGILHLHKPLDILH